MNFLDVINALIGTIPTGEQAEQTKTQLPSTNQWREANQAINDLDLRPFGKPEFYQPWFEENVREGKVETPTIEQIESAKANNKAFTNIVKPGMQAAIDGLKDLYMPKDPNYGYISDSMTMSPGGYQSLLNAFNENRGLTPEKKQELLNRKKGE